MQPCSESPLLIYRQSDRGSEEQKERGRRWGMMHSHASNKSNSIRRSLSNDIWIDIVVDLESDFQFALLGSFLFGQSQIFFFLLLKICWNYFTFRVYLDCDT